MVVEAHAKFRMTKPGFLGKQFTPEMGKCTKNVPKIGFLDFFKKITFTFSWMCYVMKFYDNFCVSAQKPYLGKVFFLKFGTKHS